MWGALKTEAVIDQLAAPTCQAPDECLQRRFFCTNSEFLRTQSALDINFLSSWLNCAIQICVIRQIRFPPPVVSPKQNRNVNLYEDPNHTDFRTKRPRLTEAVSPQVGFGFPKNRSAQPLSRDNRISVMVMVMMTLPCTTLIPCILCVRSPQCKRRKKKQCVTKYGVGDVGRL